MDAVSVFSDLFDIITATESLNIKAIKKDISTCINENYARLGITVFSFKELCEIREHCMVTFLEGVQGVTGRCERLQGMQDYTDIDWVLKEIKKGSSNEIMAEAVVLKRLEGVDGVQQLVGVCSEKNLLVTRYAGIDLYNFIAEQEDHDQDVSTLFQLIVTQQVAGIVERISARGVLYNDINLSNVCLQESATGMIVTVIDFRHATFTEEGEDGEESNMMETEDEYGVSNWPSSDAVGLAVFINYYLLPERELLKLPELCEWVDAALSPDSVTPPTLTQLLHLLPKMIRQLARGTKRAMRYEDEEDEER